MTDIGIFYVYHCHFTSAKLKKKFKRCCRANFWMSGKMTDVKFPYIGHSDFTSDKADVPASFQEDCYYNEMPLDGVYYIETTLE